MAHILWCEANIGKYISKYGKYCDVSDVFFFVQLAGNGSAMICVERAVPILSSWVKSVVHMKNGFASESELAVSYTLRCTAGMKPASVALLSISIFYHCLTYESFMEAAVLNDLDQPDGMENASPTV